MVSSVVDNGPYMVVAPGFAFGHKRNDPVALVIALAAEDSTAHQSVMPQIATMIRKRSRELDEVRTPRDLLALLRGNSGSTGAVKNKILTACGNRVGTSLFLKNTLEEVLSRWGVGPYITVKATDTISAKGKAKETDVILTSVEMGRTRGCVGIPVHLIEDFTSTCESHSALREQYETYVS